MNLFDFAMQMEMDGKAYYEKMARDTDHEGLKTIFTSLAVDEQKHYDIFQKLKTGGAAKSMPQTKVLDEAKSIFARLPKEQKGLRKIAGDLDAYQHAMKLEADSARLYEEAAAREKNPELKELLLKIAAEEQKHFNILGNVYHFVNAPNQFLAWGEFSNLDEFQQFGRKVD